jgi:hypothetical protein
VAGVREPRPAAERAEARVEVGEDLGRRHHADACGGQLDRQRQAVEPLAQRGDRRRLFVGRDEPRVALPRALDEQPVRVVGSERVQPPHGFPGQAAGLAARGQDAHPLARAEQRRRELGAAVDHVLAAPDLAPRQLGGQAGLPDAARAGHRHESRPPQRLDDAFELAVAADQRRRRDGRSCCSSPRAPSPTTRAAA